MRLLQHHFDALSLHIFQDHLCLKLYGFHYQFHLVINLVFPSLELIDFDLGLSFDFGFAPGFGGCHRCLKLFTRGSFGAGIAVLRLGIVKNLFKYHCFGVVAGHL